MASVNPRQIRVVAAVIERDGTYLITQRRSTAVLSGMWEFPGGKVEPNESDTDALKREVRERLGVDIVVGDLMAHRIHKYEGYTVDLNLYQTEVVGTDPPRALRVADFRWVPSSEFDKYPFPAADQPTTDLLLGIKRV